MTATEFAGFVALFCLVFNLLFLGWVRGSSQQMLDTELKMSLVQPRVVALEIVLQCTKAAVWSGLVLGEASWGSTYTLELMHLIQHAHCSGTSPRRRGAWLWRQETWLCPSPPVGMYLTHLCKGCGSNYLAE